MVGWPVIFNDKNIINNYNIIVQYCNCRCRAVTRTLIIECRHVTQLKSAGHPNLLHSRSLTKSLSTLYAPTSFLMTSIHFLFGLHFLSISFYAYFTHLLNSNLVITVSQHAQIFSIYSLSFFQLYSLFLNSNIFIRNSIQHSYTSTLAFSFLKFLFLFSCLYLKRILRYVHHVWPHNSFIKLSFHL